jgi:hypothetical protein
MDPLTYLVLIEISFSALKCRSQFLINGIIGKCESEDDFSRLSGDGRSGVNKVVRENCMLQENAAPCYNSHG